MEGEEQKFNNITGVQDTSSELLNKSVSVQTSNIEEPKSMGLNLSSGSKSRNILFLGVFLMVVSIITAVFFYFM